MLATAKENKAFSWLVCFQKSMLQALYTPKVKNFVRRASFVSLMYAENVLFLAGNNFLCFKFF